MANYIPKIEYGSPTTTITFDLPPEGDNLDQRFRANSARSVSSGGVEQTQFNYNEETISPKFVFVSNATKLLIDTFFLNWASHGKEFKYFESSDEVAFRTVTLERAEYSPKKIVCDGLGGFIWEFELRMRRTL